MLPEYTKKANLRIGIGFLIKLVGIIWLVSTTDRWGDRSAVNSAAGFGLILVGYPLFVWGCCDYCQAKGYHWALGLLGMLNLLGLIVMACLPDQRRPVYANPYGGYPP